MYRARRARLRLATLVTIAVGLFLLIVGFKTGGVSKADEVSGVIGAVLSLLGLASAAVGQPQSTTYEDDVVVRRLHDQITAAVKADAGRRGFFDDYLFIPPTVRVEGSSARCDLTGTDAFIAGPNEFWNSSTFANNAGKVLLPASGSKYRRTVVTGDAGSGKSTIGILAAIGLARNSHPARWLPIPLSLNTWDSTVESFSTWFDRQIVNTYSSAGFFDLNADESILDRLRNTEAVKVILILDGIDEVSGATSSDVLCTLDKEIGPDICVALIARETSANRSRLAHGIPKEFIRVRLMPPSPEQVANYLQTLADRSVESARWAPIVHEIRTHRSGTVARSLSSMFYASLTWSTFSHRASAPTISPALFPATVGKIQKFLIDEYYATTTARIERDLGRPGAAQALECVAFEMKRARSFSLPWWRTIESAPRTVVATLVALSSAPAYALALIMPPGLTKGFAIGTITCLILGITRGLHMGAREGICAAATTATIVTLVGGLLTDEPARTASDVVEMSVAIGLVFTLKNKLIHGYRTATLAIVAVTASCTAGVAATRSLAGNPHDDSSVGSVALAVALGVTLAVIYSRNLTAVAAPVQPSRVELRAPRRAHELIYPVATGIGLGMSVGLAAALVGWLRAGQQYGFELAVVFGVVVGLPMGLLVGVIRWLSRSELTDLDVSPMSTFRNDWRLAIASIVGVSAISTVMIEIVVHFRLLHSTPGGPHTSMQLHPWHGPLFGLTIGVVIACLTTAWPTFVVAHLWFVATGRLPLRFMRLLDAAHRSDLLRREGRLYQFRHAHLRDRLAERYRRRS